MSYLFTPEVEPDTITLRPYQSQALEAVRAEFRRGIRRTMVVHATGTGKSLVIAKAARATADRGGRALILAHLGELVHQNANAVERCGIVPGVEKAGSYARALFDAKVVVGSVASLRGERLRSFPRDHFDAIFPDEAHHAPAKSWMAILDHFSRARVVGFTATPDRADEERVDDVFQTIAHEFDLFDAITAPPPGPYLVPPRVIRKDIGADLRGLNVSRGDFSDEDLEERVAPLAADFANAIRQEVGERPTMIFTPGIVSAMAVSAALRSMGFESDWVSGDDVFRDYKLRRFREGESQFIACCQLLCEGVDVPRVAAVGLLRPTNSRALLTQMIGRSLRLFPGKLDSLVIDFDWLTERHSLKRPSDLFSRQLASEGEREAAEAMTIKFPGMSLIDVIAATRGRSTPLERRELEVPARIRDVKDVRREVFDPFHDAPPPPSVAPYNARHDAPSDRMIGFLKARGHRDAASFSRRRAGKLIGIYKAAEAADAIRETA